jgi:F-type H+-transporting ATPase subunit a
MAALGENLQRYSVVKYVSFMIPLPFYLLEFLIGIIQASVFTLLVSVYIGLISNQGDEYESTNLTQKELICLES